MKDLNSHKKIRDLGVSIILQISFGSIFLLFAIGLITFHDNAEENAYFIFILIGMIMLLILPLIYFLGKYYIGSKIKDLNIKEASNSIGAKTIMLIVLIVWILNKINFRNLLKDFTAGNEVVTIFLVPIILMAFFLLKTNLLTEAIIFTLGVIVFHMFAAEITVNYLIGFYFFMGFIFLTGGILDFQKFSKIKIDN